MQGTYHGGNSFSQEKDIGRPVAVEELLMALHMLKRQWHLHRGLLNAAPPAEAREAGRLTPAALPALEEGQMMCKLVIEDTGPLATSKMAF